jgi:hypothetical protein
LDLSWSQDSQSNWSHLDTQNEVEFLRGTDSDIDHRIMAAAVKDRLSVNKR